VLPLLNRASASPDAPRRALCKSGSERHINKQPVFTAEKWSLVGQCAV
jgi:hypothetical protein